MSLLEDVFLEDEANEAEELERVIEGDEFEERRCSDSDENSEKEDEAEEEKRRVDPTKTKTAKVVKNPRFLLNPARLTGPRGIQVIPEHFKDFKFKGKGYEKEDLDLVLKRLEHWAYRLYPKFQFEDCLKKIEMLGKKRPVAVHLHKIRSDQFLSEDTVVQKDSSDEDTPMPVQEEDEFDKLLQQQIELARSTPAPNSANKPVYDGSISPKDKRTISLMMPKATSSPSINEEQRERMLRSRRLAEERRLARLKNAVNTDTTKNIDDSRWGSTIEHRIDHNVEISQSNVEQDEGINKDTDEIVISKKHNRSHVIDSSDEETMGDTSVSIAVDVHATAAITTDKIMEENEKSINNEDKESDSSIGIRNKTEHSAHNISNLELSESDKLRVDNKDNVEEENDNTVHNMSPVNDEQDIANLKDTDSIHELRYDDSDMNIDLTENNGDKNNEIINSVKHHDTEERIVNDINDFAKGLNTETTTDCIEDESKVENNKTDCVPVEIIQNVTGTTEKDITNNVAAEGFEDVMDVDFTEDF